MSDEVVLKSNNDPVLFFEELLARYKQLLVDSKILAYALLFHPTEPNAVALAAALLDPPESE